MDVTANILNEASKPKRKNPKRPVLHAETKPLTPTIAETAVKLIDIALKKDTHDKNTFIEKVDKASVSVKAVYEAFGNFEKAVGGREKLLEALSFCPPTSLGYQMMLKLVEDPDFIILAHTEGGEENLKYTLAALCRRHKIPFNAIVASFRDASLAQMTLDHLVAAREHIPVVMDQLAIDSQNRYAECTVCHGTTRVYRIGDNGEWAVNADGDRISQLCFNCRGEGKIYKEHDFSNRKLFLESTGLVTKQPLVNNTVNLNQAVQNNNFTPGSSNFEKLMKAVDTATNIRGQAPIEAEIVDVEEIIRAENQET